MEKLTSEQESELKSPLPVEAVTKHPTKTYLSSIKAIYVTERLNDVFGIGAWQIKTDFIENAGNGMVVVKAKLEIPRYGIYYESFGGNDNGGEGNKNFDLGDAYKGATTDAITKICSYMGIGADVFKGKQKGNGNNKPIVQEDLYTLTQKDVELWNGKIYGKSVYINEEKKTISDEQIAKLKAHAKYVELPAK